MPSATLGEKDARLSWSESGRRFELHSQGPITLAADDSDVAAIDPNGWLTLSDGDTRTELRLATDGTIVRRFWAERIEQPWEPAGRTWWSVVFPRSVKRSGFAAEQRVSRILAAGGVDAVLSDIERVATTDAVRARYFVALFAQAPPDERGRVLPAVASIQSSRELRRVLSSFT